MPLTPETSEAISNYLLVELARYIKENAAKVNNNVLKPFHARLLPTLFNVPLSERSFSTRSGVWFQQMARLVAQQYHPVVHEQFEITGTIQPGASAHIETLLQQMDKGVPKRKPSRNGDMAGVLSVQSEGGAQLTVIADLFVGSATGEEWYFEMKTVQPNKGQCKEMKRFILQIAALRFAHQGQAFASFAYNPKGDGAPLSDGRVKQFLEPDADILVGRDFWAKIGDPTTYDELLVIAQEVGEKITAILEKVAQAENA
jgi:hypothetical protein